MDRTQIVEIAPRDGEVMYPAPDGSYTRQRTRAQLCTPEEAKALLKVLRERWPNAQLRAVPYKDFTRAPRTGLEECPDCGGHCRGYDCPSTRGEGW